jgi:FkbM family methyltransferase
MINLSKERIVQWCRLNLPEPLRKSIGSLAGKFSEELIRPIEGFIFDISGGRFYADGCKFVIPTEITTRSYRSCFLRGDYEEEERELIRTFLRAEDAVLELGACLGIVSCVTNKLLGDKSRHVVVEGNPFCIPTIHRNRELNNSGFLVENAAVSIHSEATFYLHPVYVVGGTTQRQTARSVRVPGRSLEELDSRYGPFTVLIMDIEGSEFEIFSASTDALTRYRMVIVELHAWAIGNEKVSLCRDILSNAGLKFQKSAGITEVWRRP